MQDAEEAELPAAPRGQSCPSGVMRIKQRDMLTDPTRARHTAFPYLYTAFTDALNAELQPCSCDQVTQRTWKDEGIVRLSERSLEFLKASENCFVDASVRVCPFRLVPRAADGEQQGSAELE